MNGYKEKNHMNILINTEKAFDNIKDDFMMKILGGVRVKGTHLNIRKAIYDKPTEKISLNREKLKIIPLKS